MLKLLKGGFFLEFVCVELESLWPFLVWLARVWWGPWDFDRNGYSFVVTRFQCRVTGGGSYLQMGTSVDCAVMYRIPVLLPYNHIIHNGAGDQVR